MKEKNNKDSKAQFIVCPHCNATEFSVDENGMGKCAYCGATFVLPKDKDTASSDIKTVVNQLLDDYLDDDDEDDDSYDYLSSNYLRKYDSSINKEARSVAKEAFKKTWPLWTTSLVFAIASIVAFALVGNLGTPVCMPVLIVFACMNLVLLTLSLILSYKTVDKIAVDTKSSDTELLKFKARTTTNALQVLAIIFTSIMAFVGIIMAIVCSRENRLYCPYCNKVFKGVAMSNGMHECPYCDGLYYRCPNDDCKSLNIIKDGPCYIGCDDCGTILADHWYYADCDTTCNKCGQIREAADHIFSTACSTICLTCEDTFVRSTAHTYDDNCDATCNLCSEKRTPPHNFISSCDTRCDCGAYNPYSTTECTFDYDCDDTCNLCGRTRYIDSNSHQYDHSCDTICNICGLETGTISHKDSNKDGICDNCNDPYVLQYFTFALNPDEQSYALVSIDPSLTGTDIFKHINITIPSVHNGLPVTSIRAYAMSKSSKCITLTIPSSVTTIEANAFANRDTNTTKVEFASAGDWYIVEQQKWLSALEPSYPLNNLHLNIFLIKYNGYTWSKTRV